MKNKTKKYVVELSSAINPDDYQRDYVRPKIEATRVPVDSFAEASKVCREYIKKHELGGGNWDGGMIYENRKAIAHVSYNGRVWEGTDRCSFDKKEIEI